VSDDPTEPPDQPGARPPADAAAATADYLATTRPAWTLGVGPGLAVLVTGLVALALLAFWNAIGPQTVLIAIAGITATAALFALWIGRGRAHLLAYMDVLAEAVRGLDDPLPGQPDQTPQPPPTGSPWADRLARRLYRLSRERTAHDRRRQALTRTNQIVLDALPDPLILLNHDFAVVWANAAARHLLGGDSTGRLAAFLRHPDVLDAAHNALADSVVSHVSFTVPVPTERIFAVAVVPLASPAADGTAAILALHDTTAAQRMDAMRADFVANVSHELRTPLAILAGFVETLRGPARDDERARARFLSLMADQTGRMSHLVDDLLSLSRVEMHEHSPPTGRINLAAIARQVASGLEMRARSRDMAITIEPPAETPDNLPPTLGDEHEIAQVLTNLVDNAIKYGRPGTSVRVRLEGTRPDDPSPGRNRVHVTDSGDGIPPEQVPRLTERFYRVDTARSRSLGGTGLGLAIVKHIVNRHQGQLTIHSEAGQGTTVAIALPVAPVFGRPDAAPAAAPDNPTADPH